MKHKSNDLATVSTANSQTSIVLNREENRLNIHN